MKKYIYSFFLNILVFSFVFSTFEGISVSKEIVYSVLTLFSFSVAVLLHRPVLKFLTVKINFLTYWLSVSLIMIGMFFLLSNVMPGFGIAQTTIPRMDFQVINVASFELSPIMTIIVASMAAAFVSAIMEFLKRGEE